MLHGELSGPDLSGVVADAAAAGLPCVVIGGFSVIAHGYLRATRDSGLLVPDGAATDEALLRFFDRIEAVRLQDGKTLETGGQRARFASLRSLVGFKRLADRGQDRLDLEALERINGELPIDPIPGLDL